MLLSPSKPEQGREAHHHVGQTRACHFNADFPQLLAVPLIRDLHTLIFYPTDDRCQGFKMDWEYPADHKCTALTIFRSKATGMILVIMPIFLAVCVWLARKRKHWLPHIAQRFLMGPYTRGLRKILCLGENARAATCSRKATWRASVMRWKMWMHSLSRPSTSYLSAALNSSITCQCTQASERQYKPFSSLIVT